MDDHYVAEFMEHLRVDRGLCTATVTAYRRDVNEFIEYLAALGIPSLGSVRQDTVAVYYRIIAEKRNVVEHTVYRKTRSVYVLYEWLKTQGYLLVNPCPKPPSYRLHRIPRRLPRRGSIAKMFRKLYASTDRLAARDYSIIDLAYSCGLRRAELERLNVDDVCPEDGTVRVRGKGGHERLVPVGKETIKDLQYYIYRVRPKFFKGGTTRALFVTARQGGKRIDHVSINRIFWRSRRKYGTVKTLTPHALRHAFATDLLRGGAPLQDVSGMLGHVSFETTQIYTRVVPSDLKRIHRKYHPRG